MPKAAPADEIGDMPPDLQTRLLRVLQEGEYTTVGGRTPIRANVRIVAATHRDLTQLIRQGLFREDLFYRLNVVPIRLPPLRADRRHPRADPPLPAQARKACRQDLIMALDMLRGTAGPAMCAKKPDPPPGGSQSGDTISATAVSAELKEPAKNFGGFRRRAAIPGRVCRAISDSILLA
jgi:hypothetical protein